MTFNVCEREKKHIFINKKDLKIIIKISYILYDYTIYIYDALIGLSTERRTLVRRV